MRVKLNFYLLDNSIIATWWEDPDNQFDSNPSAGELSLDDFLSEIKQVEEISDKERENISKIIEVNKAAIREKEHNREINETMTALNASLNHLIKCINLLEMQGIYSEWYISRDGQTLFETSKEKVQGSNKK